jgi:hypothetical protein
MYYTYGHYKADSKELFYIGKGKNNRLTKVWGRSVYWKRIVEKHGFTAEILAKWETEQEALEHEKFLILCLKDSHKLCNLTAGGDGISGLKMSDESKKKMSDAKKRIMTVELKKKISDATKKAMANPEVLKRMSEAIKGRKASYETKKKLSIAQKRRIRPPETGRKISLSKMGHKHSAETLEKMRIGHLGKKKQEYTCPHCAKVGRGPAMYQWHFDMCRNKP